MTSATPTAAEIRHAAQLLRTGQVVAFPTETVYGLGADATQPLAVARVFEIKQRPHFDPLIVHIPDTASARQLVLDFPPEAEELARRFWPGPLTLVLPRQPLVADLVTSGLSNVGVRVPNHPVALALLQAAQCPVAAPSANPFGGISPTLASHVRDQLGEKVDYILDGGPCAIGVESTVLSLLPGQKPCLLRPGGLPLEDLEAVLGPISLPSATSDSAPQLSPGLLTRHYAPRTPLQVLGLESLTHYRPPANQRTGLLLFTSTVDISPFTYVETLSTAFDLRTIAAGLFAALRRLDAMPLDLILTHWVPPHGLGLAINDRLRRASATDA